MTTQQCYRLAIAFLYPQVPIITKHQEQAIFSLGALLENLPRDTFYAGCGTA